MHGDCSILVVRVAPRVLDEETTCSWLELWRLSQLTPTCALFIARDVRPDSSARLPASPTALVGRDARSTRFPPCRHSSLLAQSPYSPSTVVIWRRRTTFSHPPQRARRFIRSSTTTKRRRRSSRRSRRCVRVHSTQRRRGTEADDACVDRADSMRTRRYFQSRIHITSGKFAG